MRDWTRLELSREKEEEAETIPYFSHEDEGWELTASFDSACLNSD